MKRLGQRLAGLAIVVWAAWSVAAPPVASQAWIRVLPGDLPLAGYLLLSNPGQQSITLVGAHSPAVTQIEIHRGLEESGVARMMKVERATVPAHGRLAFSPGDYHLMLFGRAQPLQPGGEVVVTLEFADGSQLPVPLALREATAR